MKVFTKENPYVKDLIARAGALSDRVIVATLPIFPFEAQKQRLSWIGLTHDDFDLVTDFTTSCYSKPSVKYYLEILDRFSLKSNRCLMVGNDVSDDIIPSLKAGMQSYLVIDCLLNGHLSAEGARIGTFRDLNDYLQSL